MYESKHARIVIAVTVLLLIGGAVLMRSPIAGQFGGASGGERLVTGIGRRSAVTLEDGSRVELSVASTLAYPAEFASSERAVLLSGEGFFTVSADSARPFVVTAAHSRVETRGAAFAVRATTGENSARVVVAEGAVAVGLASRPAGRSRVLRPGQLARISRDGAISRQDSVNVDRFTAWRRGRIVFTGAPLRDAIVELARWYDVDLRIGDSVVANRRVTAEFSATQTVTEVLDEIALGIGAVYRSQGRVVTFRRER